MTDLGPGDVISYPYLWAWQSDRGETEGRKDRPTVVAVSMAGREDDIVVLLAITGSPPGDRAALEVPQLELRRAGLSEFRRAWIILDEANFDSARRSWYLDPSGEPRGRLSRGFLRKLTLAFRAEVVKGARRISRR